MRRVCLLVALAGVAVLPSVATAQSSLPDSTATASGPAEANLPTVRLYMPDGQLKSHLLRVFLTGNVEPDQHPRLQLLRSHAVLGAPEREEQLLEPSLVAPGQEWTEVVDGREFQRSGTVLLFNARDVPFGMRATIRVMPVLVWTSGGTDRRVLGSHEVNVGNIVAAISWTVLVVGLSLLVVIALAGRDHPVIFLTGVDGHLSLAQTQVALWTIVVGGVVLGYGLIRLQIPDIPTSLVVLMGASLATGGVAYFQDAQKQQAAAAADGVRIHRTWAFGDLVRVFAVGQPPALSLAKAQMLFWTLLLLVLFISKSILDGAIWEVPWPLVALMGFSQAGYLAPKLTSNT
jgi:hypothetical protein